MYYSITWFFLLSFFFSGLTKVGYIMKERLITTWFLGCNEEIQHQVDIKFSMKNLRNKNEQILAYELDIQELDFTDSHQSCLFFLFFPAESLELMSAATIISYIQHIHHPSHKHVGPMQTHTFMREIIHTLDAQDTFSS